MNTSPISWCHVNESYASLERGGRRVGEFIRFKNGHYVFYGESFRHFIKTEDGYYMDGVPSRFGSFEDVKRSIDAVLVITGVKEIR